MLWGLSMLVDEGGRLVRPRLCNSLHCFSCRLCCRNCTLSVCSTSSLQDQTSHHTGSRPACGVCKSATPLSTMRKHQEVQAQHGIYVSCCIIILAWLPETFWEWYEEGLHCFRQPTPLITCLTRLVQGHDYQCNIGKVPAVAQAYCKLQTVHPACHMHAVMAERQVC